MSDSPKAVFLSYAREDTDAARRIAEALRGFGVEVWFDQAELHGGDAWDQKIRRQIRECALFVPIVSQQTEERAEGYFRREWKIAIDRTQDMGSSRAFIVPVVIDGTKETGADVPEEFMRYQWTRLSGGTPTPEFVALVKRLLEAPRKPAAQKAEDRGQKTEVSQAPMKPAFPGWTWGAAAAVLVAVAAGVIILRQPEAPAEKPAPPTSLSPAASSLSPTAAPAAGNKSIAVLPFVNMSAEKENEFFADGVHDDVITNLAKIRDLKVISRTSVLPYRDTATRNLKNIAAELGVANVLEGSVRRAGNKVRVTAQLIDARTDEHLWAETYDGDLTDIFALQARLAREIAAALKATLTAGEQLLIARRPTENQEAYDLFLRGRAMHQEVGERGILLDYQRISRVYEQALAKDSGFALAQAQVALVHSTLYWFGSLDPTPARAAKMKAAVDAAVRLAPDAPETHLAQGAYLYRVKLNWSAALAEFRLAAEGLPNDAQLAFWLAITNRRLGRWTESIREFERSVTLNPRDFATVQNYTAFLNSLRRWDQGRVETGRLLGYFPGETSLLKVQAEAIFALTGDREAYARGLEQLSLDPRDPVMIVRRVSAAQVRDDLAAADRILSEADQKSFDGLAGGSAVNDPVALLRAQYAYLRGDKEATRRLIEEATEFYRTMSWNERQLPWVRMRQAFMAALAGRSEVAIAEGEAALVDMIAQDAYGATQVRRFLGEIYLILGRRDQAFAVLRQMMTEPCELSPHAIRIDPIWSRLKDDPRFEEILRSAKPL